MARTAKVEVSLTDVEPVKALLSELAWITDNSEGVVGLQLDGGVLPWRSVLTLYMPTLGQYLEDR